MDPALPLSLDKKLGLRGCLEWRSSSHFWSCGTAELWAPLRAQGLRLRCSCHRGTWDLTPSELDSTFVNSGESKRGGRREHAELTHGGCWPRADNVLAQGRWRAKEQPWGTRHFLPQGWPPGKQWNAHLGSSVTSPPLHSQVISLQISLEHSSVFGLKASTGMPSF